MTQSRHLTEVTPDRPGGAVRGAEAGDWYAVHTRSRFENKVYQQLSGKDLEAFLPRMAVMSRRRDRRRIIMAPLFPGYVFVNAVLSPETHLAILRAKGVVKLVGSDGRPVPVKPEEISNLMILDGTDRDVRPQVFLNKGDRVMIVDGPLTGLVGIYRHRKNQAERVVVSVEFLKRSVFVEIEDWALEKLS
ncbi:MAG: UpxY family transcription antiterminator [Proteobacteria bacterium]|nr:UpxY family transcription antiterminator [Pseudomonadota bacterium]